MTPVTFVPWRQAWQDALYGPTGFYRRPEGPAGHFTTSTTGSLGAVFAQALAELADTESVCRVVDVGCGRGELLAHLSALRPDLELIGVDVVPRPGSLPATVHWLTAPGGADLPEELTDISDALVIGHEWLDVVPCTLALIDDDGVLREVLVDRATGRECPGDPAHDEDLAWVHRWWPDPQPGHRIEVGRSRDEAYAALLARVRTGLILAVDYGHTRTRRPQFGTLAAYRLGEQVAPVPDGSCDLTAHVAFDSLGADQVLSQSDALSQLGLRSGRPAHTLARRDPAAYLQALARSSVVAALSDPDGLGGFSWALTRVASVP